MQSTLSKRNISQIYLTLVPFLGAIIAFGVGHVSYKIYLPIWLIHSCLMVISAWILGAHFIRSYDVEKKHLVAIALFLIVPWIFISIFSGMGPPPPTVAEWVETAAEQQIRYFILIIGGVLITFGFALLREELKKTGEKFYSLLGFTAIMIAIPLFIINMTFWGSFLVESFRIFVASDSEKRPDWYLPMRDQFGLISVVEVALTYLATASFAVSLKISKLFKPTACNIYIIVSLLGFLLNALPPSSPERFATASFAVSIPAFPFIMPYLIGINLLRRAGN